MNNEIKEILDYLKEDNDKDVFGYVKDKLLAYEEGIKLVDYITNLQEENEKLKLAKDTKCASEILCECLHNDYKSRNEKAIKYIRQHSCIVRTKDNDFELDLYLQGNNTEELLNILGGDDKE